MMKMTTMIPVSLDEIFESVGIHGLTTNEFVGFLGLLLLIPIFYLVVLHRKKITIVLKTLPRDLRFLTLLWMTQRELRYYEENDMTILDLFRRQVKKHPDKVVIYFEEEKWTFKEVDVFSNRVGNAFKDLRFEKGDVVALLMPARVEYVGLWLGLAKIGVVTALVSVDLANETLAHCLKSVNARAVIYSPEFESAIRDILPSVEGVERCIWRDSRGGDEDTVDLADLVGASSTELPVPRTPMGYQDKALCVYTSAKTEVPKAAVMRHNRLLVMSTTAFFVLGLKETDVVYNPLPLHHATGGLFGVVGSLSRGFSLVIKRKFSPDSYWPDCIKYKCTVGQYAGEMCRYLMAVPPRPEDAEHRVRFVFGNGMRRTLWKDFEKRFRLKRICEIYGSTEGNTNLANTDNTVGAVGFLPRIVPEEYLPMAVIRVDDSGEPIRDSRGFCIKCLPNEPGLLVGMIKSRNPMMEYSGYVGTKKNSEKKVLNWVFKPRDRAYLSGDLFAMDELGYLYFKDEMGDTYRRKGENVSTVEVAEIMSAVVEYRDVMVYGVEVGDSEKRVGMMAIVDPDSEINVKTLAVKTSLNLPPFARPVFLRITNRADLTETFELNKSKFRKEGFDPDKIRDKLYMRNKAVGYVEFTKEMYDDVIAGKLRV